MTKNVSELRPEQHSCGYDFTKYRCKEDNPEEPCTYSPGYTWQKYSRFDRIYLVKGTDKNHPAWYYVLVVDDAEISWHYQSWGVWSDSWQWIRKGTSWWCHAMDNIPPYPGLETVPNHTWSHLPSALYRKCCMLLIISNNCWWHHLEWTSEWISGTWKKTHNILKHWSHHYKMAYNIL